MAIHTINVADDVDGTRLDRFLVSILPDYSRSHIQRLIKDGHVLVAGHAAKSNQQVKAGQAIQIDVPEPVDPVPRPEALPLSIVYQDRDLIVVDKPAGMSAPGSLSTTFARPKSMTLAVPSFVSFTLDGFRSRWMMPRS